MQSELTSEHRVRGLLAFPALMEVKAFVYVLKRKAACSPGERTIYALGEQESLKGIYLALLVLSVFEIPVVHLLLHSWRPSLAWGVLLLSLCSVLYLYGLFNALTARPTAITAADLEIRLGLEFTLTTPLSNISRVERCSPSAGPIPDTTIRTSKTSKPTLVIHFHQRVTGVRAFGKTQASDALALSTTNDAGFLAELDAARVNASPGPWEPEECRNDLAMFRSQETL